MDTTTTDGGNWASFLQGIAQSAVGGYFAKEQQQSASDFEIQKAKIQYLGQYGYFNEGQTNTVRNNTISPTMLLLIAAAVVLVVVMDK